MITKTGKKTVVCSDAACAFRWQRICTVKEQNKNKDEFTEGTDSGISKTGRKEWKFVNRLLSMQARVPRGFINWPKVCKNDVAEGINSFDGKQATIRLKGYRPWGVIHQTGQTFPLKRAPLTSVYQFEYPPKVIKKCTTPVARPILAKY